MCSAIGNYDADDQVCVECIPRYEKAVIDSGFKVTPDLLARTYKVQAAAAERRSQYLEDELMRVMNRDC
jgi:hypothetical protein